jgi:hypothetical protein
LAQDGLYKRWGSPGYGFSLTAGLKIAINTSVSIDPVFQMSLCSFGHGKDFVNFNTKHCLNYMVGIRIVMCDAIFVTFGKRENSSLYGGSTLMPTYRKLQKR